jgi:PAS domain S-box-containing protein
MSGRKTTGSTTTPEAPGDGGGPGRFVAPAASERAPRSRRDPLAWSIALLSVFIALYSAWWASGLINADVANRFTGAWALPGGVIVTLVSIRLSRLRRVDARTRQAWSIFTVALVSYGLGALIHFGTGWLPPLAVVSPLGTGLEIATYPLVTLGLTLLPKPARTKYDIVLFSLDAAIVAWSGAMIIWHFMIYPVAREAGQDIVASWGASVFPVFDLALVFSIAAIVLRGLKESTRAALSVMAIALLFVFCGDMVSDTEQLRGVYTPGGLSGSLYSIAWLGLAFAAYLQWRVPDSGRPIRGLADYARSIPWLPYIAVAVAFIAPAIRDWSDPDMLRMHVPATGLLMALVIVRLGVTARQNASLAAAEHGRLAAAVDQAAEAILTTDRAGHITYVNLAFARMTGYDVGEMLWRDPDLLGRHLDPGPLAEINAALVRGESWAGRLTLKRVDGKTVDIDMAVSPLREPNGTITGSVAVARDISRERALEVQLSQAQRMEAVGRLAGGIAHDFNNILTAITGFGELAAAELPKDHPVATDIDQILQASERAAALTRELLAFSGRQVMLPRLMDLNHVLDALTPMLGRLIGEDVQLIVRQEPNLGMVMADRARFEQVVLNLAVNARDAMPKGGTLTIATANEDVDSDYARAHVGAIPGPYVALIVTDTGVGMTPAVMEHAFEPFFTTKARGKGTGLGLSTAIGIVQRSDGFVSVESEQKVGSVFTIHLPRIEGASSPDDVSSSVDAPHGRGETILVAEDEDAVRQFVERVLSVAGYRVLTAPGGAEALALAKTRHDLDLLFTDVVMPGMSGVQLAAKVAKIHPGLPVIFASGYSEEGVLHGAGEGRFPYLPKPFTSNELLAQVREVLDGAAKAKAAPESPTVDIG